MNVKNKRELYTSPNAEVIETNAAQIICESNTERPTDGNAEWGWIEE